MNNSTTCARCSAPVKVAASGNLVSFPGVITCGSTALLHTQDAEKAAATNYEFTH
jgi:hypothetical protein